MSGITLEQKLFHFPKGKRRPRRVILADAMMKILKDPEAKLLTMEEGVVLYEERPHLLPIKLVPFVESWIHDRGEPITGTRRSTVSPRYIAKVPRRNPRNL